MPYRKRTRLWNNVSNWLPKELCKQDGGNITDDKHNATAQRLPSGPKNTWGNKPQFTQTDLYVVPGQIIHDILVSVTSATTR